MIILKKCVGTYVCIYLFTTHLNSNEDKFVYSRWIMNDNGNEHLNESGEVSDGRGHVHPAPLHEYRSEHGARHHHHFLERTYSQLILIVARNTYIYSTYILFTWTKEIVGVCKIKKFQENIKHRHGLIRTYYSKLLFLTKLFLLPGSFCAAPCESTARRPPRSRG